MNIALLGFGTVGSHFYKMAQEHSELNISAVLSRRPRPELACTVTADFDEIVRDGSIDTVVEVIGGVEPAYSYITAAMRAGKHVVTANKQLMCAHYEDLLSLAKECGVRLRCTAAAGGGIPWLTSLARVEKMDEIDAVEGILNGTTNFMLSAMTANGADYGAVLREAQALGYAEADPTADVEGLDARRKLVLSANLAFGVSVQEADIPCVGISHITAADIDKAKEWGYTFKLIARAERAQRAGAVAAFVCPTLFPVSAPEAHTDGTGNLVSLYARRIGKQSFSGAGAGGFPTASNVLADCFAVMAGCESYYTDKAAPCAVDNSTAASRWLFRRNGQYEFAECSAEEAFARCDADLQSDPCALLARVADTDQKEE
ncbi:MAG: homoserine dehydrogenase [Ruminococcaceae bacterium]|nr:homoserine dehydrogenase [Oscillospiraceae bacterium]